MFSFKISDYDDPVLDDEAVELLWRHLEANSRRILPRLWKATDAVNNYAGKGSEKSRDGKGSKRFCIYGAVLIVLGVFVLVPGLVAPRNPVLIASGAVAIVAGILSFFIAFKGKNVTVPDSCKEGAKQLLEGRRAIDWRSVEVRVEFDQDGMTVSAGQEKENVTYAQMLGIFEARHSWLLMYGETKGLLLQKKDLVSGDVDGFTSYILEKIKANRKK